MFEAALRAVHIPGSWLSISAWEPESVFRRDRHIGSNLTIYILSKYTKNTSSRLIHISDSRTMGIEQESKTDCGIEERHGGIEDVAYSLIMQILRDEEAHFVHHDATATFVSSLTSRWEKRGLRTPGA